MSRHFLSKTVRGRIGGALALVGLATLISANQALALDKVSVGTDWLADAERGGYYQAKAAGIYEKYGLDVTIVAGGPSVNNPQLLAAGQLDAAVISSAIQVMGYAKSGVPIVAVAAMYQKNPQILMAHKSQGFKSLADLKGKPIMISALARDSYWAWLKSAYGYSDDQIRPYTFSMAPFLHDATAIQQGYATYEPHSAEQSGADPQVFLLADSGYQDYAALISFRKETIEKNPALVQRFVDASIEGWYSFLYGDAAPGIALIKQNNADITDDNIANSRKVLAEMGIVDSGDAKTMGIGAMSDARWTALFEQMNKAGVLPAGDYWKAAYQLNFTNKKVGMPK